MLLREVDEWTKTHVIEVKNISKIILDRPKLFKRSHWPSIVVRSGDWSVKNGSGKSTLASIIAGNLLADEGEMFIFWWTLFTCKQPGSIRGGAFPWSFQEQGTINTISVAANILAGREDQYVSMGIINSKKINDDAQKLLDDLDLSYIKAEDDSFSELSFWGPENW